MLKSAKFEAVSVAAPETILWTADWSSASELPIAFDIQNLSHYQLRIKTVLKEGAEQDLTLPFTAGLRVEHTLFEQGRSAYTIVVGADASETEKWAAGELQHWLREIGGASLSVQVEVVRSKSDKVIVVGWNRRTEEFLGPGVQPPKRSTPVAST